MENKFTPGPWEFSIKDGEIAQVIAKSTAKNLYDGDTICIPDIPPSGCRHEAYAVQEGNARLIAAAPDLLKALEGVIDQIIYAPEEWFSEDCEGFNLEQARAAIAKALGGG